MCDQIFTDEERRKRPDGPAPFVDELVVALTNARIYSREHPRLSSTVDMLHEGLGLLLSETPKHRIQIGTADGFLFFEGKPLFGASISAARLIGSLQELGAGGLAFDDQTTRDDLFVFANLVGRNAKEIDSYVEANAALKHASCLGVKFLPPYNEATGSWTDVVAEDWEQEEHERETLGLDLDVDVATRIYQSVVGALQDVMVTSAHGAEVDLTPPSGHVRSILAQLNEDTASLMRLSRYERYDAFTFGHSIRVCFISLNFARHLTQNERILQRIGLAALMHDIGKARVPFDVLHSSQRLSEEERAEMNMHPVHGGHILLDTRDPDPLAVAVAFSHHQNHDGKGYPKSLRMGHPSAATMLVKIADVYEALTAVRPYKPRMSPVRAYRVMMDMDGFFERSLLRKFIEINGVYPVGSRVRLSSGEVARVESQTDSLLEPVVRTEEAESGDELLEQDVRKLDLREGDGKEKLAVDEAVLSPEL